MSEKEDGQTGMIAGKAPVELPKVVDAFVPAIALSEKPEFLRGARGAAMATMVVGVDAMPALVSACASLAYRPACSASPWAICRTAFGWPGGSHR